MRQGIPVISLTIAVTEASMGCIWLPGLHEVGQGGTRVGHVGRTK